MINKPLSLRQLGTYNFGLHSLLIEIPPHRTLLKMRTFLSLHMNYVLPRV